MDTETLPIRVKTDGLDLIRTEKFCSVRDSAKRTDNERQGGSADVQTAQQGKNPPRSGGSRTADQKAGKGHGRFTDEGAPRGLGCERDVKRWSPRRPCRTRRGSPQREVAAHVSELPNAGGTCWRGAEQQEKADPLLPAAGAGMARPLREPGWQSLMVHTRSHQPASDCPPGVCPREPNSRLTHEPVRESSP